jgi:hypothetical protein
MIKTPFVEKSGSIPPGSSDEDVINTIDSLIYTLQHYKETIIQKGKDKP